MSHVPFPTWDPGKYLHLAPRRSVPYRYPCLPVRNRHCILPVLPLQSLPQYQTPGLHQMPLPCRWPGEILWPARPLPLHEAPRSTNYRPVSPAVRWPGHHTAAGTPFLPASFLRPALSLFFLLLLCPSSFPPEPFLFLYL